MLRCVRIDTNGTEKQIKLLFEPLRDWIEAPGAWHFKITLIASTQTDVVDQLAGAAMLGEKIGAAAYRHAVDLTNPGAVIDSAGWNRVAEFKRLPFKIEDRNQYGHSILMVAGLRLGSKPIIEADGWLQGGAQCVGIEIILVKTRRLVC